MEHSRYIEAELDTLWDAKVVAHMELDAAKVAVTRAYKRVMEAKRRQRLSHNPEKARVRLESARIVLNHANDDAERVKVAYKEARAAYVDCHDRLAAAYADVKRAARMQNA